MAAYLAGSALTPLLGSTLSVILKSQLSDLNRVPARYEGAALPGELSWHKHEDTIAKKRTWVNEIK